MIFLHPTSYLLHSSYLFFSMYTCLHLKSTPNLLSFFFFFFNDTATPEIYTLSLPAALPIFPIAAFVLLERGSGGATLEPVGKSDMLKEILLQNFARQVPPVELLDRLMRLTERVPCYRLDRKSTRLNSSHQIISYAVFCLKKK